MEEVKITHDINGNLLEVPIEFVLIPAPTGFRYRLTPRFSENGVQFGYSGPNNVGDVKPFYVAKYVHHDADKIPTYVDHEEAEGEAKLVGGRLPTEYEWEWAAYGGEDWEYAGCTDVNKVAWTNENCEGIQKVGLLRPNGYGLFDMSGLVFEWTSTAVNIANNITDEGWNRVIRGGGWYGFARIARVAYRYGYVPSLRIDSLGFRLCFVPPDALF